MTEITDVLVVGGGPIGLLVAYQLLKFKCKAICIERDNKPSLPIYGRATTMWCRTLEILDQLGLCEPLMNDACFTKDGYNFRNGVATPGGMPFGQRMDKIGDSRFAMSMHIRQRLIERVFEEGLEQYDSAPCHQHELVSYTMDESKEHPITAIIKDAVTENEYTVSAKYIVGADGARSLVRKTVGIPFNGDRSGNKWIRMDALVETNMPSPRTLNSVQSESHGLVLWCPIDEGKVRIGYVFNAELQKKYGEDGITGEVVMEEAKKAIAPFSLEFKSLDWFTCYGIGQCMAESFVQGRVILAGDSCHTHSSGSAQGLNTGVFDATNLGWKLALCLKGRAGPDLLETYDMERRAAVQQVIDNDKIISTLISGHLPPKFADRKEHPRDILDEWFDNAKTIAFTLGLGISYPKNNLLNVTPVQAPIANITPGERGPEAYISRLGTNERVPLQRLLANDGCFHVVIFAGLPQYTQKKLEVIRSHLDSASSFATAFGPCVVQTLTIFGVAGIAAGETMGGIRSFGRTYYDVTQEAHQKYGVDTQAGALFVFRPDGYVCRVVDLGAPEAVTEHLARFLVQGGHSKKAQSASTNGH